MTTLYTVLEVCALLAVIVIPLSGPKKTKTTTLPILSDLLVNENGYLEYAVDHDTDQHHPVI